MKKSTTTQKVTSRLQKAKAHQRYQLKDGTIVPGCSTIAKVGSDPSALLYWAWECGMNGIDYKKARDAAADIGTVTHYMIECFLAGVEPDFGDYSTNSVKLATIAFEKFKDWWVEQKFTTLATEEQLVSEVHRYGGTADYPCRDKEGRRVLLDWKTSKAFYPEHAVQLVGLEVLQNENHSEDPVRRRGIVRIGKEHEGDFDVWWLDNGLDLYWDCFQKKLALYNALKKIDNRRI